MPGGNGSLAAPSRTKTPLRKIVRVCKKKRICRKGLIDEIIFTKGVKVDCREFVELISEAVDDRLRNDVKRQFSLHAGVCSHCRGEFEVDRITKSVLHKKLPLRGVPSELQYSVLAAVRGQQSSHRKWLSAVFGEAFLNPAVALVALAMVAVGAVSLLQRNNALPISSDKNIIAQSLKNYSAA